MSRDLGSALSNVIEDSTDTTDTSQQLGCLQRWADNEEFWAGQPHIDRFYFGSDSLAFVSRNALRALLLSISASPAVSKKSRTYTAIPCCGDLDCNTCDLVPIGAQT